MGGKLLLKLNIGTRPIANKYREGKMKSTLKRKLIVRETVKREAHGISNALSRFRSAAAATPRRADPNGLPARVRGRDRSHFPAARVNSCWNRERSSVRRWPASVGVITRGGNLGFDRGVSRHALLLGGWPLLSQSLVNQSGLLAVRSNRWRLLDGMSAHVRAEVVGGHMISCDPS